MCAVKLDGTKEKRSAKVYEFEPSKEKRKDANLRRLMEVLKQPVRDEESLQQWCDAFTLQPDAWAIKQSGVRVYLKATRPISDFVFAMRLLNTLSALYKLSTMYRTQAMQGLQDELTQLIRKGNGKGV